MTREEAIICQLQKKGYRLTEQRRLLIGIILEGTHLSCKEIYFEVKKKDPAIGIATVYRTIAMLEELNVLDKGNNYHIAYDQIEGYNKEKPQIQCRCAVCGRVLDVPGNRWINQLLSETENDQAYEFDIQSVTVHGLCSGCKKEDKVESSFQSSVYSGRSKCDVRR